VGGAGAVLRGVEARGAGARPPPAPLQALQLLLLRPPAQHLREYIHLLCYYVIVSCCRLDYLLGVRVFFFSCIRLAIVSLGCYSANYSCLASSGPARYISLSRPGYFWFRPLASTLSCLCSIDLSGYCLIDAWDCGKSSCLVIRQLSSRCF